MERFVAVDDGVRLWCADDDRHGPDLVLCHGGPGLWDVLEPLAVLVPDPVHTIRWEQRGCGRSDRVGPYTVARTLADLDGLRVGLGIDRWIVGGHSWGATVALHHALARPDAVRALVYVSGVGIGRAWNPVYHDATDRRLTPAQRARRTELEARDRSADEERELCTLVWSADFADRERAVERAAAMADVPFVVNRECNAAINAEVRVWDEDELAARCRHLEVPALIIHGGEDTRPSWAVDSLAAALPRSEVHVVAGAGHLPWVEAPDETRRIIESFLHDHALLD